MNFYRNFCTAWRVSVVILGHLNRSFYLLTYLLTVQFVPVQEPELSAVDVCLYYE